MDTLQSVFPDVPLTALARVLEICDDNVETASEWILQNDWRELLEDEVEEADQEQQQDQVVDGGNVVEQVDEPPQEQQQQQAAVIHALPMAMQQATITNTMVARTVEVPTMVVSTAANLPANAAQFDGHAVNGHRRHHMDGGFDSTAEQDLDSEDGEEEDEDDEDEDDDDEDDDEDGHSYYDSSDEAIFHGTVMPLTKRLKVTRQAEDMGKEPKADSFWAAFDGQVVTKDMIELLNTTLSKLAHSSVTLLNRSPKHMTEVEAAQRLQSILTKETISVSPTSDRAPLHHPPRNQISLSHILNGYPTSSPTSASSENSTPTGQKRKREETSSSSQTNRGFFAHFFPVSDLDMVWRSVMHAHLFNGRFGELIEFHTASGGAFDKRDFDELMHIHTNMSTARAATLSHSPLATLKCCLILPCEAREEEIFRVGKHLHTLLKLPGSLYYRTLDDMDASSHASGRDTAAASRNDLFSDDGKMTEDSFRRFAKYRIKKEEVRALVNGGEAMSASLGSRVEHSLHDCLISCDLLALAQPSAVAAAADSVEPPLMGSTDRFLAYQQQHKAEYSLQFLKSEGWDRRLSS